MKEDLIKAFKIELENAPAHFDLGKDSLGNVYIGQFRFNENDKEISYKNIKFELDSNKTHLLNDLVNKIKFRNNKRLSNPEYAEILSIIERKKFN